jgi:hypothetical protein
VVRVERVLLGVVLVLLAVVPSAVGSAAARSLVRIGDFESPLYVAATPADAQAIYVVEQGGRIIRVAGGRRSTFFDIRGQVLAGGEQGLLSIAFHPRYARNRLFYVDYTALNGNSIIAEFRARGSRAPVRTRVLLNLPDPAPNHNGGLLLFGRDGRLWWGNGDGGGGGDSYGNGQRTSGFFAKIMRLDVDRRKARWQTWAIGARNPWRFSFDRANGDLYIADVGQNDYEELHYVANPLRKSRLNFGWNRFEGRAFYSRTTQLARGWRYVPPILAYGRGDGCSVTGGYVYRGRVVRSAVGRYFYGDYCTGIVWSLRVRNGRATDVTREPFTVGSLSSFGEDVRGELYLTSLDGPVYRLGGS